MFLPSKRERTCRLALKGRPRGAFPLVCRKGHPDRGGPFCLPGSVHEGPGSTLWTVKRTPKPADVNQRAKAVVEEATREEDEDQREPEVPARGN